MKFRIQTFDEKYGQWHKWFAWRPVSVDKTNNFIWLETIERRGKLVNSWGENYPVWYYRTTN